MTMFSRGWRTPSDCFEGNKVLMKFPLSRVGHPIIFGHPSIQPLADLANDHPAAHHLFGKSSVAILRLFEVLP